MFEDFELCLVCRLTTLAPSTIAVPASICTALMVPRFPRSLPRRIITVSPLTTNRFVGILKHLRCERGDLQEASLAQLAHDRPEDAGTARVEVIFFTLDDHASVIVAANHRAVQTPNRGAGPHHHGLDDLTFFHGRAGNRALDGADDHVAHVGVNVPSAAGDVNHEQLASAAVVGNPQTSLLLNHLARSTISSSRQRFSRDSGRHSPIRTTSPMLASLRSSCALKRVDLRTILP